MNNQQRIALDYWESVFLAMKKEAEKKMRSDVKAMMIAHHQLTGMNSLYILGDVSELPLIVSSKGNIPAALVENVKLFFQM